METKHILIRFAESFEISRINEKSFFKTLLGFTRCWDYKHSYTAHDKSPAVYTSDKNFNLSTVKIIHLRCDCIDRSVVNGIPSLVFFSFVLHTLTSY